MPVAKHDVINELAQQILGCVCAALDATAADDPSYPGCPCRACVVAGQPAWDNCCGNCPGQPVGGQLHVWSEGPYPVDPFPVLSSEVRGFKGCQPIKGVAADFLVELVRCAPSVDEYGDPPSCEELDRAARVVHIDSWVMFQAITCCLPQTGRRGGRRHLVRQPQVIGPDGGCVANRMRITVDLNQLCACPPDGVSP